MPTSFSFLIYTISFFLLYTIMSWINLDEKIFFFLTPTIKDTNNNKKTDSPENIITPEGASKPLTLTKAEIGRHSWALLHSMANTYPETPNEKEKSIIEKFMYGLAYNYPCRVCGKHLLKMLNKRGVKANSRKEFINYLCDIHNIVNKVLNKTKFDCEKSFQVWNNNYKCYNNY